MKNNRLTNILIPLLFVILNFILKGLFLGNNSLGGDEPFSVYHAQMDPGGIIHQLTQGNNPPLYELVLHFWIKWFGISEFAVRFPSLIFSSLTVFFIYKIGQHFFNLRVAIYSGIIYSFSTYHILFAHEARSYALMGLLTAISMFLYLKIIVEKTNSKGIKALFLLVNALLIYTHFFGFFVLFIQFFFILLQPKLLREFYKFLLLFVGVLLLLYSPNILIIVDRFFSVTKGGTWVTAPTGISDLYEMFRRWGNAPVGAVFMIVFLLTGLVTLIIKRKSNPNRLATRLVYVWFFVPLLFMFGISFVFPVFLDRYLMFVAIGGTLALGLSADSIISHPKGKFVIPVIMCLLFVVTVKPNKSNNRLERDAVQKVKELKNDQTLVVIAPYYFALNFSYYYDRKIFTDWNSEDVFKNMLDDLKQENVICINSLAGVDFNAYEKVIFLDVASNFAVPDNGIFNTLNSQLKLAGKTHIEEIYDVYVFSK